jgi:dienelactone hydrolase
MKVLAQPFNIGHTSVTYYDSSRSRDVQTEIYYPSDNSGENVPVATGNYPVIVFGHGFVMGYDSYQNFWEEIVPQGFVLCFPDTEMGLSPSHMDLGLDLKFVSEKMQLENTDSNSIFFNSIAPKTGLMGHSMGGGASFLAAENNSSIRTLINFAAAETSPSAISAALNINVPSLIFAGEDDCVTPPAQHQILMYDSLYSDCKTFISIKKGGHCYFADYNFLCSIGESSCNPTLDITREEQQLVTFDFLNLWLQYTLYDDLTSFSVFNDSLQSSTRIDYMQYCSTSEIQGSIDNEGIRIFPNPMRNKFNLALSESNIGGKLLIYNTLGQAVYQLEIHSSNPQIDLSELVPGTYIAVYLKDSFIWTNKIIKTDNY